MDSSVFLNGEQVGGRLYGYSNFFVDITGKLNEGSNELKVIVDNSVTPNSRWYSGSGIYRDVNLWIGEPTCITPEGISPPTVSLRSSSFVPIFFSTAGFPGSTYTTRY